MSHDPQRTRRSSERDPAGTPSGVAVVAGGWLPSLTFTLASIAMLHLFTVADRFQIEGRGCVLVPGLPTEAGSPNVRNGARIRLRRPDGRVTDTVMEAIEMISYRTRPEKICLPILLPRDITKEDAPVGTEVLLLEEKCETIANHDG